MPSVIYWVQDLLFVSKIREVARQLGIDARSVRDAESLHAEAPGARLLVLDLRLPSALAALDRLAADPATRAVPKVGFIDHERTDVMERARGRLPRAGQGQILDGAAVAARAFVVDRELLFADQELAEVIAPVQSAYWRACSRSVELGGGGDVDGARAALGEALTHAVASREVLLAANALRRQGGLVEPALAARVAGAILEVPVDGGLDTLAAYDDGSAHYFNQGRLAISYEAGGGPFDAEVLAVTRAAQAVLGAAPRGDRRRARQSGDIRVVLLTPGSTRVVDLPSGGIVGTPYAELFDVGTHLLELLVGATVPPP
jgi:hypothetical protein